MKKKKKIPEEENLGYQKWRESNKNNKYIGKYALLFLNYLKYFLKQKLDNI